jgi:F-type H+-transporting ATPase subunit b
MTFSWWTFALQAANFLILVWLLQRFLFKPVKSIVARRKEEISRAMNHASAEKVKAEDMLRALEAQRSGIQAEHERMLEATRAQLSAERRKMLDEARQEAEKAMQQALKRIDEERAAASDELLHQSLALAQSLAERLLRDLASESLERPFLGRVAEYLDGLPARERMKLLPENGRTPVSVTTAHPLAAREQSEWREELAKRFGASCDVTFGSDPDLIAGALIEFPGAILRFNWRDTLATALKEANVDAQSH